MENEAARLRTLAAHCRHIAETLASERNAETLRMMAVEFEASADACERLPLIKARPIPGRSG